MHALVLAVALSPSPVEEKFQQIEQERMLPVLRDYWIAMGVLEEYEYRFRSVWSLEMDVRDMQWRMENVPMDAPPFDAGLFLPETFTALTHCRDGHRYRQALEEVRPWLVEGPETAMLDAVIEDSKWRSDVWDLIYSCQSGHWSREGRRYHLHRLREAVGREAFEKGEFPDPLPPAAYLWTIGM
jgi:hypothetical protein